MIEKHQHVETNITSQSILILFEKKEILFVLKLTQKLTRNVQFCNFSRLPNPQYVVIKTQCFL
jgi:hypothetical protein